MNCPTFQEFLRNKSPPQFAPYNSINHSTKTLTIKDLQCPFNHLQSKIEHNIDKARTDRNGREESLTLPSIDNTSNFQLNILPKQMGNYYINRSHGKVLSNQKKVLVNLQNVRQLHPKEKPHLSVDQFLVKVKWYKIIDDRQEQKPELTLQQEADEIHERLISDKIMGCKFHNKVNKNLTTVIRNLISIGHETEFYVDPQRLRSIHLHMNLKDIHFIKFKNLILRSLMKRETPVELVFKGCQRIQSYRPWVLNEQTEFEVYGRSQGIQQIAEYMYSQIFTDITLSQYFEGIDLQTQAMKFAKAFTQLIFNVDVSIMETLRIQHTKYKLTYVHLANFKLQLSKTLQFSRIPPKYIRHILRRIDIYKYAIINKQTLQDVIQNYGTKTYLDQFMFNANKDPILAELIRKRGPKRFMAHAENILHYFFRYNVRAITRDDIEFIHKGQDVISEVVFDRFKYHFCQGVYNLTQDRILLEDFQEDWDEVKPLILDQSKTSIIKKLGGFHFIDQCAEALAFEFKQYQLDQIYQMYNVDLCQNLRCKLNLLLYGVHFYKRTELEVLHRHYNINENQYFSFVQSFKTVFGQYSEMNWLWSVLDVYKKYIVND